MQELDNLFNGLKKVERPTGAKEKTLQKLQGSRSRKRRSVIPSLVTGVLVVAALLFIMMNMEKEVSPYASGVSVDKSFIMYSVSVIEFDPELVDHIGKVEIKDNPVWSAKVKQILETMSETEVYPEGMSLYDLGVYSGEQLYRFKIWATDDGLAIKDVDSGIHYVSTSEESDSFLKMAEEFLEPLKTPPLDEDEIEDEDIDTDEEKGTDEEKEDETEVEKVPTMNLSKEQLKSLFNNDKYEVSIKVSDIEESADGSTVKFHLVHEKNGGKTWSNIEMTSKNDPKENQLTNISLFGAGLEYDAHSLYYFLEIFHDILQLPVSTDEFVELTGLYPGASVQQVDEQFNLGGFTFTSKVSEEGMRFIIEPIKDV
ncbi:hypothetical protein [Sporosarcina sp. 6E9]|uniref:hypothetical protein n=1 Tax=Sporosarcina sp. 6E9 TaxID=2819235 RepID=UPI001B30BF44|nr:hypothetical protein [Sporosarcina sp. 6E9]